VAKKRLVVVIAMLVNLWTGAGWAQTLQEVGFSVGRADAAVSDMNLLPALRGA
jgi:hypothetical protein